MKRSEINRAIVWARELLKEKGMALPDMADWDIPRWQKETGNLDVIRRVMLGWDVTDFGMDDFAHVGAVLYTVRNGCITAPEIGVPYCEKLILMQDGQRLPKHYHVFKTEDIICRAGRLQVRMWNTERDGRELSTDVQVRMDGRKVCLKAGEPVEITPGNSVTLTPYLAHVFGPVPGSGSLVAGEVSRVNDDRTDNYFLERTLRYAHIEEDEVMICPLCNEYGRL